MESAKSAQTPLWRALLLGALAGFIVSVALDQLPVYVASFPERMFVPFRGLIFASAFFVPSLIAGIVSHLAFAKVSWVPRLTWLLLALLYFLARAFGILAVNILLALLPSNLKGVASWVVSWLFALLASAFWLLLARTALAAILSRPQAAAGHGGRQWLFITGQAVLVVFVAASWLPGIGTLVMGGGVGVTAMTALAVFGTARRSPEDRSPAFLIALWLLPVAVLVSAVTAIARDL